MPADIVANPFVKALALKFVLPFCIFTSVAFLMRGKSALKWSRGVMKSAGVNFGLFVTNTLFAAFVLFGGDEMRAAWRSMGGPQLDPGMWNHVPLWLVVLAGILVHDLADYWNHRLLHGRLLWPVHAVHHSDPDMNFTTTFRIHVLEPVVMKISYLVLISWMSMPSAAAAAVIPVLLIFNMYLHADLDWDHGPLKKVLASPRYHQWHHANEPSAYNKNFANVFSFWDVLFGTFHCPGKCTIPYGFEGSPNHDFVSLWVYPFRVWGEGLGRGLRRLGAGRRSGKPPASRPAMAP